MLTSDEREQVEETLRTFGYLGRGEIDALRATSHPELPFDLLARAVLEEPSARLRWASIQVLDHYDDHRHDDAVAVALGDPVPRVRRHAAHALGCDACSLEPGPVDPVPPLVRCVLEDENTKVRRQALFSLFSRRVDDRVRAALAVVATDDPDERMRRDAGAILART